MYIELIDLLRCPREHPDSWLVAAFIRMDGRFVVEGKLGCPVCSASYWIRNGIADLREIAGDTGEFSDAPSSSDDEQLAMRAAALLGLTKPNSLVVLAGRAARLSHQVSELADARVMSMNPETGIGETERVSVILAAKRFPFAPNSVDGIMLDEATAAFAPDASRILRQGGRLIAPKGTILPAGFREMASDEKEIVAESIGELISLSR